MKTVHTATIGECWRESMRAILNHGSDFFDEDVVIRELMGLDVRIDNPRLTDPIVERFGDPEVVTHTLKKFEKGTVMSNRPFTYADCIYNKNGVDQFEWMIDRLTKKPETKSATICLLTEGNKHANLPCLTALDAKIRDNKVNVQFFFRSQNIVGRQYANLLAIAKLQFDLAARLGLDVGFLGGYIASAHIYDYDLPFARSILDNEDIRIRDLFYEAGPKSIRTNTLFG